MERNYFKERTDVRMASLGLNQKSVADMVGVPKSRVSEAMGGDMTPAATHLRMKIDNALDRMIQEKRKSMIEEIGIKVGMQQDNKMSLILPEDMVYVVTYDGFPVGTWNPIKKIYQSYEEA